MIKNGKRNKQRKRRIIIDKNKEEKLLIKERSIRKWKTCGERGIDKKKRKEINKLKEKKELIKEGENGVDKRKEEVELIKEKRKRNC